MVTLTLNGAPAPASYALGSVYLLAVLVDGADPLSVEWSVGRRNETPDEGTGTVRFEPAAAETYYLYVSAVGQDGVAQQTIFQLQVTSGRSSAMIPSIRWSNRAPNLRETVVASVRVTDPNQSFPSSIAWTVYLNGVPVLSGESPQASVVVASPGVYRVVATVLDQGGASATADSSIVVPGGFELPSAIAPKTPTGTLYYLGSVYSVTVEGSALTATQLPYLVTSATSSVHILPGTTHIIAEIEDGGAVQDDVVLRTTLGNWTLNSGLTTESLTYDYVPTVTLPAPHDRLFRYTLDHYKVSGLAVSAYKFRVRFKCYREGQQLYQYDPCPHAQYPGGEATRQNRMVALITHIDFKTDAESPDTRFGSVNTAAYTTPDQITLKGNFTPDGAPDRVVYREEDHGFTAQNIITNYEAAGHPDIKAHAVYGLPGVRPAALDFTQPGLPRIIQYAKRLYGKLAVYMAGGGVSYDTYIRVRIYTGKSPGYRDYSVRALKPVYNGSLDEYVKVGEVDIDLSDFEFGRVGLTFDFTLDESVAHAIPYWNTETENLPWETEDETANWEVEGYGTTADYQPGQPATDSVYATTQGNAIVFDGACFYGGTPIQTFDGTHAVTGTLISDCTGTICGPRGVYCYTDGTSFAQVIQPLDNPAPFLAFVSDQAHCWHTPAFIAIAGTGTVGLNEPYIPYSGTSGCGIGYAYTSCGAQADIAVIYPTATSPHSYVAYGSSCYALSGSVADLRPYDTVAELADVDAVADCQDVVCTGSNAAGGAANYLDQNQERVDVYFPYMTTLGIPSFAVSRETSSPGYGLTPPGSIHYNSWAQEKWGVMTAQETAVVDFTVTPTGVTRALYVQRGSTHTKYSYGAGESRKRISLQVGDFVYISWAGKHLSPVEGTVSYAKRVTLPALYHTTTLDTGTASAIQAVSFCGYGSRDEYVHYATVPVEREMSLPNPDSIVTVSGSGSIEQLLIRTYADGERYRYPVPWPVYAGESLNMPVTFKFYAGRGIAGRHGEMDVWLDTDQSLPEYLRASRYHVLTAPGTQFRVNSQSDNVNRRGLQVVTAAEAQQFLLPRVYAADDGQTIVVVSAGTEVFHSGKTFTVTGTDPGISTQIYTAQSVAAGLGAWMTGGGEAWVDSYGTSAWSS